MTPIVFTTAVCMIESDSSSYGLYRFTHTGPTGQHTNQPTVRENTNHSEFHQSNEIYRFILPNERIPNYNFPVQCTTFMRFTRIPNAVVYSCQWSQLGL
jgi:hypothetical protein